MYIVAVGMYDFLPEVTSPVPYVSVDPFLLIFVMYLYRLVI